MAAKDEESVVVVANPHCFLLFAFLSWTVHRHPLTLPTIVPLSHRERIEQAPVDGVLLTKLIESLDLDPLLASLEVQHLDCTDVRRAAKLVKVPVVENDQAGGASGVVQVR